MERDEPAAARSRREGGRSRAYYRLLQVKTLRIVDNTAELVFSALTPARRSVQRKTGHALERRRPGAPRGPQGEHVEGRVSRPQAAEDPRRLGRAQALGRQADGGNVGRGPAGRPALVHGGVDRPRPRRAASPGPRPGPPPLPPRRRPARTPRRVCPVRAHVKPLKPPVPPARQISFWADAPVILNASFAPVSLRPSFIQYFSLLYGSGFRSSPRPSPFRYLTPVTLPFDAATGLSPGPPPPLSFLSASLPLSTHEIFPSDSGGLLATGVKRFRTPLVPEPLAERRESREKGGERASGVDFRAGLWPLPALSSTAPGPGRRSLRLSAAPVPGLA